MSSHLLISICLLSLLTWLATLLRMLAVKRAISDLPDTGEPARAPRVSIIVPARNEQRDIEVSIRSLLDQSGIEMQLLVVNDHSEDATGAIIDRLAATDDRLNAIHDPELQPGWFGKANAMQTAAQHADRDFLLFTDADVIHGPGVLRRALAEMEAGGYDFMSLVPRFEINTFWENVDLPMVLSGLAMLASTQLENPDKPGEAVGGGAFLLIRRDVFNAIGGFEPIRTEMFDDVMLARLVKANGYKVGIRSAIDHLQVELFKTNRDAFLAPTKNILGAGMGRPWLTGFAALAALVLYWSPPLAMALGVFQSDTGLWLTGLGVYLGQYTSFFLARQTFHFRPLKLLGYPLVVLVILTCTARALYFYYARGSVAWRGRVLKHGN